MTQEAVLHKINLDYLYPLPDNKLLFKIKTKKNDCDEVILHTIDKYKALFRGNKIEKTFVMEKFASDFLFDYYQVEIEADFLSAMYYFEFKIYPTGKWFYGNYRFFETPPQEPKHLFIAAAHWKEDIFSIPGWMNNAVVYSIFPDRFNREESAPDSGPDLWHSEVDLDTILGGTLKGITEKLDYLDDLGINVIYLNPVFTSDSNHRYNIFDYYSIDPGLGTLDDLKELVASAHERDIRVIMDAVFNHTGLDFFAFKDIREHEEKSQYLDWYHISSLPILADGEENPNFKSFGYFYKMPKLNLANEEAAEYFLKVGEYWIKECNIDGWRLDVADEISHSFWKKFRQRMKKVKSDLAIVGEVWYDSSEYLAGDEFDSIMNYPFLEAVDDFLNNPSEKAVTDFSCTLGQIRGTYNKMAIPVLWNIIDSHDSSRFLHKSSGDKALLKLAVLLQFTLPGTPVIYYGDEVGMTGGNDPDNRQGMIWDKEKQDRELLAYFKKLIKLRADYPQFLTGSLEELIVDDNKGVYGFKRSFNGESILVIINLSDQNHSFHLSTAKKNLLTGMAAEGEVRITKKSGIILK